MLERCIYVLDKLIMRVSVLAFLAAILLAVVEIGNSVVKFQTDFEASRNLDKQLAEMMQPIAIETKKGK